MFLRGSFLYSHRNKRILSLARYLCDLQSCVSSFFLASCWSIHPDVFWDNDELHISRAQNSKIRCYSQLEYKYNCNTTNKSNKPKPIIQTILKAIKPGKLWLVIIFYGRLFYIGISIIYALSEALICFPLDLYLLAFQRKPIKATSMEKAELIFTTILACSPVLRKKTLFHNSKFSLKILLYKSVTCYVFSNLIES